MSLLYPHIYLKSVCGITEELLKEKNITGLIIDIDNTLTAQDGFDIPTDVQEWLDNIINKVDCVLVSNNKKNRVEPFARQVKLPYISFALKPAPFWGLGKALKSLNKKASQVAVVGDQLFTDVIGGHLLGATTIRVEPLLLTEKQKNSLKRKLETKITSKYTDKQGEKN